MVAELAAIAERAGVENVYFGTGPRDDAARRLEQLPPGAPELERWRAVHELAGHELRLGNIEAALPLFDRSLALMESIQESVPASDGYRALLDWAVAHLRWGEAQNCVARHTAHSCLLPIGPLGVHADQRGARRAVEGLETVLANFPDDLLARWLLNIAAMTLGEYPDGVPPEYRIPPSAFASERDFPRFPDVAAAVGLSAIDLSGGALIDDFDGDLLLDVVTSTWDSRRPMHYFRNDGDGRFTERTRDANLHEMLGALNLVHADYDDDGDLDIYALRGAWNADTGRHPNSLLQNDGSGTFTDVTLAVGLGGERYPSPSAAWGDYDLDGDLDLFVCSESSPEIAFPCQLFRNDGGRFRDVARAAGVENFQYAKAAVFGDYDGDRWPDLYVSNLYGPNRLYKNQRDGTFVDVAAQLGVEGPYVSFPAWWWDYDNDGALDLYVASWEQDMHAFVASWLGLEAPRTSYVDASTNKRYVVSERGSQQVELSRLYRGDGHGGFRDVAPGLGLKRITLPMGCNFGDLDNDGWLDFYLGTGFPAYEALMPNVMYWNDAGRRFLDVSAAGGFGHLQKGHGIAFADLDNDGDQDVFARMGGAQAGDTFDNVLFENPGFGNHWLKVSLVGVSSNRCGIGARLRVDVVERGAVRTLYKHVNTGAFFGGNPLRQELGLGAAERIERLEVYWPQSDTTQAFTGVPLDTWVVITEGQERLETRSLPRLSLAR
jgi:hypothetical protein